MFGYVTANRKELTPEGLARYKAVYCGLCGALKTRLGGAYRLALSYDMVFLALLLSSLYEPERESHCARCIMHPIRPCPRDTDKFTDYAADMTVALFYHKCLDDWRDEGRRDRLRLAKNVERVYFCVKERYGAQCRAIEASLSKLGELERANSDDVDALATCFGQMLAALFSPYEDMWAGTLRAFGTQLGRYIYVTDAWDDVRQDIKRHRFNPLSHMYTEAPREFDARCEGILKALIARAAAEFEKLPLVEDIEIMRNVLYSGVWTRFYLKRRRRVNPGDEGRRADAGN